MKEIQIRKNDAGQRLDRFVGKAVPLLPESLLQKYIRLKRIKRNGKGAKRDVRLVEGDVLQLYINDEFFERPTEENAWLKIATPRLDIVYEDEKLVGGWAKAYRKDRSRPFYEEVKLSEYDTKKSLWATKPATMIRKVALVHALRESFPATFGSLYDESEVPVDAEASCREVENEQPEIGAMQPRKLKPKKEQPEPLAAETTDTNDDPFGGDGE